MKTFFTFIFSIFILVSQAQYIGVKARYTETRTVANSPEPPSRESRLLLTFYEVTIAGVYIPVSLSNYPIHIYTDGFQYGSLQGGVYDSSGNNYPGYAYTAPAAVAYGNSYGLNYIDCNPNVTTPFTVNGHELDCGFIRVSFWESGNESFTAPNICLPYYRPGDPYFLAPGNVNFTWPVFPTPPYNLYSFSCAFSTQQAVVRGVLPHEDGTSVIPLPIRFDAINGTLQHDQQVKISWSNLTETHVDRYEVEKSSSDKPYQIIGTVLPVHNNGGKASYDFFSLQPEASAFYRIKAIESNQTIFYSPVVHIKSVTTTSYTPIPTLSVFPNPSKDGQFTFHLPDADKGRYLSWIVSTDGRFIKHKMINHTGGPISRLVNLTGLPSGVYEVVLQSTTKRFTQKIIHVN